MGCVEGAWDMGRWAGIWAGIWAGDGGWEERSMSPGLSIWG